MPTYACLRSASLGLRTALRMEKKSKIYVAGHRGLVGSAIVRKLMNDGYTNILCRTHDELDLKDQIQVAAFFQQEKPEYVFLSAAKVGGILANNTFPAEFIYQNLMRLRHFTGIWYYFIQR